MSEQHITRTLQMRLSGHQPELDASAEKWGVIMRTLYATARAERKPFMAFKAEFCNDFGIASRHFNAIVVELKGRIDSIKQKAIHDARETQFKLDRLESRLAAWREKHAGPDRKEPTPKQIKARNRLRKKIAKLKARIAVLERTSNAEYPRICFGTRDLFKKQHNGEANGYSDKKAWHAHWREMWIDARSRNFLITGSNDELSGNATCRAFIKEDGSVDLRLALLDGTKKTFSGVRLEYGHDEWLEAIRRADVEYSNTFAFREETSRLVDLYKARGSWPKKVIKKAAEKKTTDLEKTFRSMRKAERKAQEKDGAGIAYRFIRDNKGWRIMVTFQQHVGAEPKADFIEGCIGVDMNVDHLAVGFVKRDGHLVFSTRLDTHVDGKTTGQRLAIYRHAADALVKMAKERGCPIAVEKLDFKKGRSLLSSGEGSAKRNRMVSSFATTMFRAAITSACRRANVALVFVNPAFTSVLGRLKAVDRGISVHQAAAWVIARRAIGFSEAFDQTVRVSVVGHQKPTRIELPSDLRSKAEDKIESLRQVASGLRALACSNARREPLSKREEQSLRDDASFLEAMVSQRRLEPATQVLPAVGECGLH